MSLVGHPTDLQHLLWVTRLRPMDLRDPQSCLWGTPWISRTPKLTCGAPHGRRGAPESLVGRPMDCEDPQCHLWGTPWISRTPKLTCGAPHGLLGPPASLMGHPTDLQHLPWVTQLRPKDLRDPQPRPQSSPSPTEGPLRPQPHLWGTPQISRTPKLTCGAPHGPPGPPSSLVGHPMDLQDPQPHLWGTPWTSRTPKLTCGAPHGS